MNLKLAKRLRGIALSRFETGASLRASSNRDWFRRNLAGTEYERHAKRGTVRVSPTCPRGLYLRLKRAAVYQAPV